LYSSDFLFRNPKSEIMLDPRLLFVAAVWGVNFSAVKLALADFHPLGFTVVRFGLAAVFLVAVMLVVREPLAVERRDRFAIVKLGFIGITLYNIFFMYGLKYTTVANSALLVSLSPLFGALLGILRGRERLTARAGAGLALSTFGVFLIIRSHYGEVSFSSSGIAGDLLTFGAPLTWAVYTASARPLLEKYSAVKIASYSMFAGCALLLPLSLPGLVRQSWTSLPLRAWSALAFSAFIAGGAAYALWYRGVKRLGVTRTIVYHYVMPFAAVLFATLATGEKISALQIAGGAAILAGVYLVQRS
jgi:drug/metabolite transporter (DMT)-like permease